MKTIYKGIILLCIICAATLMSGCMESDDNAPNGTIVDATIEKIIDTADRNEQDLDELPIAATIEGAMPGDYTTFTIRTDGFVEQHRNGEYVYGTWELSSQTETSRTYDFDLDHDYSLTILTDGSAELTAQRISGVFKGTWE